MLVGAVDSVRISDGDLSMLRMSLRMAQEDDAEHVKNCCADCHFAYDVWFSWAKLG